MNNKQQIYQERTGSSIYWVICTKLILNLQRKTKLHAASLRSHTIIPLLMTNSTEPGCSPSEPWETIWQTIHNLHDSLQGRWWIPVPTMPLLVVRCKPLCYSPCKFCFEFLEQYSRFDYTTCGLGSVRWALKISLEHVILLFSYQYQPNTKIRDQIC